jgi:hypothetical protein
MLNNLALTFAVDEHECTGTRVYAINFTRDTPVAGRVSGLTQHRVPAAHCRIPTLQTRMLDIGHAEIGV